MYSKALLYIASALMLLLVGCGGGYTQVNQAISEKGKALPGPILNQLEIALAQDDSAALSKCLGSLEGNYGDTLDWDLFWAELDKRTFKASLVQRDERFLRLHEQDCSSYPSFAQFISGIGDHFEYVIGSARRCDWAIPPKIAIRIVKQAIDTTDQSLIDGAFSFLAQEVSSGKYSLAWNSELLESQSWISQLALEQRVTPSLLSFLKNVPSSVVVEELTLRSASSTLFNEGPLSIWFSTFGFENAITTFEKAVRTQQIRLPTDKLEGLLENAIEDLKTKDAGTYLLHYSLWAEFLRYAFAHKPLADRFSAMDRLLRAGESWLQNLDADLRAEVIDKATSHAHGLNRELDLQWLVYRSHSVAAGRIANVLEEEASDPFYRILSVLARINVNSLSRRQTEASVKEICDLFQIHGLPNGSLTLREAVEHLEQDSLAPAGCFLIKEVEPGKVTIGSDKSLKASFATLLIWEDRDLELSAPEIRLGAVVVRATREPAFAKAQALDPAANGIVFPILLGVTLPEKTSRLKQGTYFFIVHHTERQPQPGGPELQQPSAGLVGPHLTLLTDTGSALGNFKSIGGSGQPALPPRQGGRGDVSEIDPVAVQDWLDAVTSSDRLELPGPVRFLSQLNYDLLEDLLSHADRDSEGLIKVNVIPEYVNVLSLPQKTKIIRRCEQLSGQKVTKSQLAKFLQEEFATKAIQHLDAVLSRSKSDGLISVDEIVPELDAGNVFKLEPAAAGPKNQQGMDGSAGTILFGIRSLK